MNMVVYAGSIFILRNYESIILERIQIYGYKKATINSRNSGVDAQLNIMFKDLHVGLELRYCLDSHKGSNPVLVLSYRNIKIDYESRHL